MVACVYVLAEEGGGLKIGWAMRADRRARAVATNGHDPGRSYQLMGLSPEAARAVERVLHLLFRAHRTPRAGDGGSEWFSGSAYGAVRAFIEANRDLLGYSRLAPVPARRSRPRRLALTAPLSPHAFPTAPPGWVTLAGAVAFAGLGVARGLGPKFSRALQAYCAAEGEPARVVAISAKGRAHYFPPHLARAWATGEAYTAIREHLTRTARGRAPAFSPPDTTPADAHKCSHRPRADVDNC